MKKHLLTLLTIFMTLPVVWANTFYFNINQEDNVSQIKTDLQTILSNAKTNDTIIVTGSKTNADTTLFIFIDYWKTVIWQANYQSSSSFGANHLISFVGEGTFEVANGTLITENANAINGMEKGSTVIVSGNGKVQTSGVGVHAITTNGNVEIKDQAQVNGTEGETIDSNGDNAIIRVSGGVVSATSENAIITRGKDPKIYISGGYVFNDANSRYPAIYIRS